MPLPASVVENAAKKALKAVKKLAEATCQCEDAEVRAHLLQHPGAVHLLVALLHAAPGAAEHAAYALRELS